MGSRCSKWQLERILSYIDIGTQEGAKYLTGGKSAQLVEKLSEGFYVGPTAPVRQNKMHIFHGPVLSGYKVLDP